MKFWEAMKALDEGKNITHLSWRNQHWLDKYCDISIANEILDNDWEIYEEPKKEICDITGAKLPVVKCKECGK